MRSSGGVRRHAGKAAAAASTARFTSSAPASGTRASTSPVAGFGTSSHSLAAESTHSPLMKFGNCTELAVAVLMASLLANEKLIRQAKSLQKSCNPDQLICSPHPGLLQR